jgi:23S rRNA (cytosine1962-C5)-methyltransferase
MIKSLPMTPTVEVNERGAARLRGGNPWVYAPDVTRRPEGDADVVTVVDGAGRTLGTALYAARGPLPLRLVARDAVDFSPALIEARLLAALSRRRALFPAADAFRVVHGEADGLPGLVIDRYADVAVIQSLTAAIDRREEAIAALCRRVLDARLVVARDDGSARDLELLPRRKGVLAGGGPTQVAYHDAGSRFEVDVLTDGKTGGFLDQAENHARARVYAGGVALDAFTYHGGFALALAAGGAHKVLALDESAAACARARANAARNGLHQVEVEQANAFDRLRALEAEGHLFDVVVIDPPALAKRRGALGDGRRGQRAAPGPAERAYKELNLRAFRLVRPGGVVVTCSCSGRLSAAQFGEIVEAAARDARRSFQVIERRGAGRDHPTLLGVPETEYLKCWFLRALD